MGNNKNHEAFAKRQSKAKVYWKKNKWWILGLTAICLGSAIYNTYKLDYKVISIVAPIIVSICFQIYDSAKKEKPNYQNEFEKQFYNRISAFRKISDTSDSFINDFYESAQICKSNPQGSNDKINELYVKYDLNTLYLRINEIFKHLETYEYTPSDMAKYIDILKSELTMADLYKLFFLYNYAETDKTFTEIVKEEKLLDGLINYIPPYGTIYEIKWFNLPINTNQFCRSRKGCSG